MVSMLSGPVPPYAYDGGENFVVHSATRTRPEGQSNASKGQGSSVGLLLQVEGMRISSGPSKRTMKSEPKDHMRDNVRRMRQIQRQARKKEEESKQPVKAVWKTSKFDDVTSKLKEQIHNPAPSRPQSANYLRAHSRTGWTPVSRSRPSSANSEVRVSRMSVPAAVSAREVKLVRHEIDFVKANGRAAKHSSIRRSPSLTALDDLKKKSEEEDGKYQRGLVPKYLVSRQREWEQEYEERIANTPDPDLPPGHKVMPDHERRATLEKLKHSQKELMQQMSCLPVRTDTFRLRTRKNEIESKLAEVEEAIKIFSRPKVFVAVEA